MKSKRLLITLCLILVLGGSCRAATLEGIAFLNHVNLAGYFNGLLQYLYDSHGCLHFTPADIYLLSKTIPPGTVLEIKCYSETDLPFSTEKLPYFADSTNSQQDITYYRKVFRENSTKLLVYPALNRLFVMVNGEAYLQVRAQPGPEREYIQVFNVEKGHPIDWDMSTMTPTDAGRYKTLKSQPSYRSNLYAKTTLLPFGAQMTKSGQNWVFTENGKSRYVPRYIVDDLLLLPEKRYFNYYDVKYDANNNPVSARWGSHDFGIETLLWSRDGSNRYPELGYAEGELLFTQVMLVKDLAQMLTQPEADDFDDCVSGNDSFSAYRDIDNFIRSGGKTNSPKLNQEAARYYLLVHKLPLLAQVKDKIDPRILKAFADPKKDKRELGLYEYALDYVQVFEEKAHWYRQFKADRTFWQELKIKLRDDFRKLKVNEIEDQHVLAEKWLTERLRFTLVTPPPTPR